MPRAGDELSLNSSEKPPIRNAGGAESGALGGDSDLKAVISAWPDLPADVRKMIVGVVNLTTKAMPR